MSSTGTPMRVLILVDGEHYPPVVRDAIERLRGEGWDVAAAVFLGGTEKIGLENLEDAYSIPVERGPDRGVVLQASIDRYRPDAVLDLSDEPVVTQRERLSLASRALARGVRYLGADFELRPVPLERVLTKASIRVIATGKRVGKTAVAGALARHAVALGRCPVIVAMGRGGPPNPETLEVDADVSPTGLLALADAGRHAASDYIEDAVTSRVPTIGCRRIGGGFAGAPFGSNVVDGARLAEERDEDLVILEGSGAAVPPVAADTGLICVPAHADPSRVGDHLGLYRLLLSDVAVVTMAEDGTAADAVAAAIRSENPEIHVVQAVFRPTPLSPVSGRRVFFCTTAPAQVGGLLARHLEEVHECEVVGMSHDLSDRGALAQRLHDAPSFDVLMTELKAGAVEVAVRTALARDLEVVFADNGLVGQGIGDAFDRLLERAPAREPI